MSDSSIAQVAGGLIGAFVGAQFGAPQVGFAVGSALGGTLVPPEGQDVVGPRLDDLKASPSRYGTPLGIPYGTIQVPGTIFWLENNQIKEVKKEEEQGGKGGGGGQTVTTFEYFGTFAVSLGEGPITGVRRVWADTVLIYDGSESADPASMFAGPPVLADPTGDQTIVDALADPSVFKVEESGNEFGVITLYRGSESQDPDPTIEADRGVGNVPGYRGTAYLVIDGMKLEKFGNRLPQIRAEVVSSSPEAPPAKLLETTVSTLPSEVDFTNDLGTNFIRIENEQLVLNWYKEDSSDPSEARDYAFSFSGQFTGSVLSPWQWAYPTGGNRNYGVAFFGNGLSTGLQLHTSRSDGEVAIWQFLGASAKEKLTVLADDDNPENGSCATPDKRHIYFFTRVSDSESHYQKMDLSANVIAEGSVPIDSNVGLDPAYIGHAGQNWAQPAVNSAGTLLWVLWGTDVHVYTLQDDDNFAFAGRSTAPLGGGVGGRIAAENNMCFGMFDSTFAAWTASPVHKRQSQSLSSVVDDLTARSGVPAGEVDTSALSQSVRGYFADRTMPVREALAPLRTAFQWDARQSGYAIELVPRGGSPSATLTDDDLGAHEPGQDSPPILTESRELETRLPREVRVQYLDVGTDYEQGSQYTSRQTTEAVDVKSIDLSIVLTANEAAQLADVLMREAWSSRTGFDAATSLQQAAIEAADVIALDTTEVQGDARVVQIDDGQPGIRQLKLVPDGTALYVSSAEGQQGENNTTPVKPVGPTELVLADLPLLRDVSDGAGYYVAMGGLFDAWPGAQLLQSSNGSTFQSVTAETVEATIGNTEAALADGPVGVWDRGNTIVIRLRTGDLSGTTELDVLNGANALAIEAGSEWEIVQFVDAAQNGDGTLTLSTLLRGRKGTEHLTTLHSAGDRVLLLDTNAIQRIGVDTSLIGTARDFRASTFTRPVSRSQVESFTVVGRSQEPYSPVHPDGSRNSSGDLTITWTRRTRIGGEWRDYVGVPLGEDSESYEVDVMDGSTVVRTLSSSSPSVMYSAADQTTDFGSVQWNGVTVRIYQISATVGRGTKREATL